MKPFLAVAVETHPHYPADRKPAATIKDNEGRLCSDLARHGDLWWFEVSHDYKGQGCALSRVAVSTTGAATVFFLRGALAFGRPSATRESSVCSQPL